MMKFEIERGKETRLEVFGSLLTIQTELGFLLRAIYAQILQQSPAEARMLRHVMTAMVTSEDSPLWTDQPLKSAESITVVLPTDFRKSPPAHLWD